MREWFMASSAIRLSDWRLGPFSDHILIYDRSGYISTLLSQVRCPMRVNVLPNGRLVLPAQMRRQLGVERGGQVVAEIDGDVVRLTTADRSLNEAGALFRAYVSGAVDVADEVIAARRAEATAERDDGPGTVAR